MRVLVPGSAALSAKSPNWSAARCPSPRKRRLRKARLRQAALRSLASFLRTRKTRRGVKGVWLDDRRKPNRHPEVRGASAPSLEGGRSIRNAYGDSGAVHPSRLASLAPQDDGFGFSRSGMTVTTKQKAGHFARLFRIRDSRSLTCSYSRRTPRCSWSAGACPGGTRSHRPYPSD